MVSQTLYNCLLFRTYLSGYLIKYHKSITNMTCAGGVDSHGLIKKAMFSFIERCMYKDTEQISKVSLNMRKLIIIEQYR